jgi:Spy/CpxP family protein refolding chaperone
MRGFRFLVVAFALLALCSPWVEGQDPTKPKDSKDPAPKMRGQLPQNWGKLGLSDEQKQKIYDAQNKHRAKIDALQKQITELKDQEKKDMENVLTDAQKARLREIVAGKAPADGKTETKPKDKP